jgi:DNA-binding GntR family transcriptional regulator
VQSYISIHQSVTAKYVYEQLRHQIYGLQISPGTSLEISIISTYLGVSRGAVLAAFRRLSAEGIVEPDGSSYRLMQIDHTYIQDIFVVRRVIELACVRLCIENLDSQRVEQLYRVWERLKTDHEADPNSLENLLKADLELHRTIVAMGANRPLQMSLDKLNTAVNWIRHWQYAKGNAHWHIGSTVQEHLQVLEAILAKNADTAAAALDAHLTLAHERSLACLEMPIM